jgi:hypothetical protein
MKDNYLWDRSGEPDPEVQELEEILGSLRYQPRPLRIPTHVQAGHRRSFSPAWAIAAAIALCAVLLGLWFHFTRRETAPRFEARRDSQIEQKTGPQPQVAPNNESSPTAAVKSPNNNPERHQKSARNLVATRRTPVIRREIRLPELTSRELAEKEQVLVALRLVSAKLNLAQRRTQGTPQLNPIRNQHKIG